jgi:hypothetical protein
VASGSSFAASVRLGPGVMSAGRIEDPAAFGAALRELRSRILGRRARSSARVNVVVSLSSLHIYSQVFALPFLEGESLEKAVALNLKMALPGGSENFYAGWQVLTRNSSSGRVEILSAFLDKGTADDLVAALRAGGFSLFAIESKAISLARVTRQASGFDPHAASVVVAADTEGLDVLIVRNGYLQFDYFNTWKDLQGDAKSITLESFQAMVVRSVSQIQNFYNSHWKEPLGDIFVGATGMQQEIMSVIGSDFGGKARELVPLTSPPLTPEWFIAFGGALRGRLPRKDDSELSLLGIDAQAQYHEEQIEHFLSFWRLLVPLALGVLLIVFAGAIFFVGRVNSSLQQQGLLRLDPAQAREIESLKEQAREFNRSIELVEAVNAAAERKAPLLGKLLEIASRRGITINRLAIGGPSDRIALTGTAGSDKAISELKEELKITPGFKDVDLPLTDIRKNGSTYTFSISFLASS